MRILVVEDDEAVASLLQRVLTRADYDVEVLHRSAGVRERVRSGGIDLLILDLTLPDGDGLDVCRSVRAVTSTLPIVMLTGRGDEIDVVAGFSAGADDYVAKPFRPAELTARVRAHLRASSVRTQDDDAEVPIHLTGREIGHDIRLDTDTGRVWRRGHEVVLTPTEFRVLAVLASAAGRAVSRDEIIEHLRVQGLSASPRSLDMHVSAIRRALAAASADGDAPIATVRGVGFRLDLAP